MSVSDANGNAARSSALITTTGPTDTTCAGLQSEALVINDPLPSESEAAETSSLATRTLSPQTSSSSAQASGVSCPEGQELLYGSECHDLCEQGTIREPGKRTCVSDSPSPRSHSLSDALCRSLAMNWRGKRREKKSLHQILV